MACRRRTTLERIVRRLTPSAESFAAAAALNGPDLMLQLAATARSAEGPPSPRYDGRSRALAPEPERDHADRDA